MLTRRDAIRIAVGFPASVVSSRAGADTRDDFWEKKPPSEWNADEIKRITTDSPWTHSPSSVFAVRNLQDRPFSERTPLDLPRLDKARNIIGRWESARVIRDAFRGRANDDLIKYYVINLPGDTWITRSLRAGNKLGERLRELQHHTKLEPKTGQYKSITWRSFWRDRAAESYFTSGASRRSRPKKPRFDS